MPATFISCLAQIVGQPRCEGLLIIGATNAPWHVDGALIRPGRFDRIVFVKPPDYEARLEILRIHIQDKPVYDQVMAYLKARKRGRQGLQRTSSVVEWANY